jgi:hypothetical protein
LTIRPRNPPAPGCVLRSLGSPAEEVERTLRTGRDHGGAGRATAETSRCHQSRPPGCWLRSAEAGASLHPVTHHTWARVLLLAVVAVLVLAGHCYWCVVGALAGQNYCQRLRSFRPDTHMKPWIIAALMCSACAAYAAEDDNKIHPTCVEENNTRRCWVDHGPPTGVRPPQLQPVAPAPQAAIPPPAPAMVPFPPPPRWWPPPLIFRFGPYGLTVPRRYPAPPSGRAPVY